MARTNYAKTKSGGVNSRKLRKEIAADPAITAALVASAEDDAGSDGFTLVFDPALSGAEETALDACIAAHVPGSATPVVGSFLVRAKGTGKTKSLPVTETLYATDNGDGTYAGKAWQRTYTYDAQAKLTQVVTQYFFDDGAVARTITVDYYTNANGDEIEKTTES